MWHKLPDLAKHGWSGLLSALTVGNGVYVSMNCDVFTHHNGRRECILGCSVSLSLLAVTGLRHTSRILRIEHCL